MKSAVIAIFTTLLFSLSFFHVRSQDNKRELNKTGVEVIDFHSTHRCATCNAIEDRARTVLKKYYNAEMKEGLITFQTVNVDEKENFKMAEEFEAAGTALFINVVKNGKSTKIDLTDFAFMNVMSDNDDFEKGLRKELDKALNLINI